MKRRILAAILAGSMLLVFTACGQQESGEPQIELVQEDEEQAYPTTTVEYDDVVKNVKISCEYISTDQQELAFPVDGKLIERVEVKEGDFVTKGQLLAALDVEELEKSIEELEYQISCQELKLQQTEEMKAFELDSAEVMYSYTEMTGQDKEDLKEKKETIEKQYKTTLEDLSDQLTIKRSRLQQYREDLEEGCLYADIAGEVTYVASNLKDSYSKKDSVVMRISNQDECYFIADDITYADCFEEGISITVTYRSAGTQSSCEAESVLMDRWETDGQMYFKPVGEEIIANETEGNIVMEVAGKENVLCVPSDAIHQSDNGAFVYLEQDGLLEMRYVTVGLEGDNLTEITDGLKQGEIIALKK